MARKTIKKATDPPRRQTRRRRNKVNPAPVVENHHHRFVSSVTFDGKKLVTKTQKDNEPVNEKIYTMDQLGEELPIGRELIETYLDGNMPRGLQEHHHTHMNPMFENVLVHPADLGLLAPKDDDAPLIRQAASRRIRLRRPESRRLRMRLATKTIAA